MALPLVYYFGDDEAYFKTLQGEFKKHTKLLMLFERHNAKTENDIQSLFLKVAANHPRCVFIDFSKDTQEFMHLARLIARTNFEEKPLTVGLVDYLSPREVHQESIATGMNLTHIKSAETFDVVFDVASLVGPEAVIPHGFATASLAETWEAGAVAKVGYAHRDGMHLETDFSVAKGDRFVIQHFWTKDKIIPSKEVFVTDTSSKNLFYHFQHSVDVEFVVVDEFIPPEGMEESTVEERRVEREDLIKRHKKKMAAWVEDNLSRSQEKSMKFLIIDQEFKFYNNQKRADKHPYIIRAVPGLKDIADDLSRLCPQLIAVSLEAPEVKTAKLDFDFLQKLVNVVKRDFAESTPFVVVFNTKISTQDLRQQLAYEHLMATDGELEADVLIKMAELLEKKLSHTHVIGKKTEAKVFIRKSNPASHAHIMLSVKVSKVSESDMVFTCDRPLAAGTNLFFEKPVPFYVNVQPMKAQGKVQEYSGLIHCIGESDKKELRRFVNSVFFRDHDAQLMTETDEFKKLNEDKLKEKLEAIRIAQEKALAESEAKKANEEAKKAPIPQTNEEEPKA